MAIAFVQGVGAQPSGAVASVGVTFSTNVGSGSLIVAGVAGYALGTYTMTDGQGNTYTRDTTQGSGTFSSWLFRAVTGSSGSLTVTFANTGGNKYCSMGAAEFTGQDSGDLLEGTNGKVDTGTAIETGTVTPAADGALFIGFMTHDNSAARIITAGDTLIVEDEDDSNEIPYSLQYYIQTTAAAKEMTWTINASVSNAYALCGVYNAATGSGGPTIRWNLIDGLVYGSLVGGRLVR